MRTVIHSATLITGDDAGTIHHNATIAIEGDRIAAIGPDAELLARFPDAAHMDGADRWVLPGFANIHTHLGMTWRAASTKICRRLTGRPSAAAFRPCRCRPFRARKTRSWCSSAPWRRSAVARRPC
jgi:imidazolonepropionase-like amidohydrolase